MKFPTVEFLIKEAQHHRERIISIQVNPFSAFEEISRLGLKIDHGDKNVKIKAFPVDSEQKMHRVPR